MRRLEGATIIKKVRVCVFMCNRRRERGGRVCVERKKVGNRGR